MRGCLAVLALAVTASAAHASPALGIVVPPAEVDVGAGTLRGDAVLGTSTEVLAGLHWASLFWKPTRFDVGVGYVGSFRAVVPALVLARSTTMADPDNELRLHGVYADVAYAIENHEYWRTWLSARVESMRASVNEQSFGVLGAAVRLSTEVYVSGATAGGDRGVAGAVAGTLALGVYVEAVHRDLPAELGSNGVVAGITMRVPFIAGVAN
jgi:hypothetical protein